MPVLSENIEYRKPADLSDFAEGGGPASWETIVDGVAHELFDPIAELDWLGDFSVRKFFVAVDSADAALYQRTWQMITTLPDIDGVEYSLFATRDRDDGFTRRADAMGYIGSFFSRGAMWGGLLTGEYQPGVGELEIIQRPGSPLPPVNKTLMLVANEGDAGEVVELIRVIEIAEQRTQTYYDSSGAYELEHVRLSLFAPTANAWTGHEPSRALSASYSGGKARLRNTVASESAKFYGTRPIQGAITAGDQVVQVDRIYSQLAPTSTDAAPLANLPLNPETVVTVDAGGGYAVDVPQQAQMFAVAVTAENRRTSYVYTIAPLPSAGLTVYYWSGGNRYALTSAADGTISGAESSYGSGAIDNASGVVQFTLGALPDIGSAVIVLWGTSVLYELLSDAPQPPLTPVLRATLPGSTPGQAILPGTVRVLDGGVEVGSDAGSPPTGAIAGSVTGMVRYASREIILTPATAPAPGAIYQITYEEGEYTTQFHVSPARTASGDIELSLPPGLVPGSVSLDWSADYVLPQTACTPSIPVNTDLSARDVGSGGLVDERGGSVGSVNHATGAVLFNPDGAGVHPIQQHVPDVQSFTGLALEEVLLIATPNVQVRSRYAIAGAASARTYDLTLGAVEIDITPYTTSALVPSSLRFGAAGATYEDRNGTLYADVDPQTGIGVQAGSVDYSTGRATLTYWAEGAAWGSPSIISGLTVFGEPFTTRAGFAVEATPLAPESLQITGLQTDGTPISAIVDAADRFTGSGVEGVASSQFGTAFVQFGEYVLDSSLSGAEKSEWWYDADLVRDDGTILRPYQVIPSSLRYNAVQQRYTPFDPAYIGINPVTIPPDARVPIYRRGENAMLIHQAEVTGITPVNDLVIPTRAGLAWVRVIDVDGAPIKSGYCVDKSTGNVTITDASGMAAPITVRHVIGQPGRITDVQISGHVVFQSPLRRDFPAGSLLCAMLEHGDRRARVTLTWDEETWDGSWVDYRKGGEATATLNFDDYPPVVTNAGADTDRYVLRCLNAATNQFELLSERRGRIWAGTYSPGGDDIAPINPRTRTYDELTQSWAGGVPIITIPGAANGGGWQQGNVIRINVTGAIFGAWMTRAVTPIDADPPAPGTPAGVELITLGSVDPTSPDTCAV